MKSLLRYTGLVMLATTSAAILSLFLTGCSGPGIIGGYWDPAPTSKDAQK